MKTVFVQFIMYSILVKQVMRIKNLEIFMSWSKDLILIHGDLFICQLIKIYIERILKEYSLNKDWLYKKHFLNDMLIHCFHFAC